MLLAAAGSVKGSSYAIIRNYSKKNHWVLLTSGYCIAEVESNISKLPDVAKVRWEKEILSELEIVATILTFPKPHLLTAGKDKPVLLSAIAAHAKVLLTLDTTDFHVVLNTNVYGVEILTPSTFLNNQRSKRRLIET
jgi:predicted nucleic acid-binding protein